MADWQSVREEVIRATDPVREPNGGYDTVRRAKLAALEKLTGRPVVLYATDFTNPLKSNVASQLGASVSIDLSDKDGFYEVTKDLPDGALDVVLYSPGGSAEATESIVELLRTRFNDIRFIVPSVAKSAATMLAMSGNSIAIDERSELGPIDPQMIFTRSGQTIVAPLHSIRDQFLLAQKEIAQDPRKLSAWVPILQQYGPSLLIQCDKLIELARSLVEKWLNKYMFQGDPDAATKAKSISTYLADDKNFLSHARRIGIDDLVTQEVRVDDLRQDPPLREAVHELHIAMMLTLQGTGAVKIFENSRGKALVFAIQQAQPNPPQPAAPTTTLPALPPVTMPSAPTPPPSRQQRRADQRKRGHH